MANVNAPGYVAPAAYWRPRVSWGPIFAGAICALGSLVLFTLLGAAIGFTAYDPGDRVSGVAPAIWIAVSWIVSIFIGGLVAGRLVGCERRLEAALHGLTVWALTLLMFVWLVAAGIGGAFGLAGQAATTSAQMYRQSPQLQERAQSAQQRIQSTLQDPAEQAWMQEQASEKGAKGGWVAFGTALLAALAGFFGGMAGLPRRRTIEDAPGYFQEPRVAPAV